MTPAGHPTQHGLRRVGSRPRLGRYLQQVWQRRSFAYTLALSRVQAQNQANRLGYAWLVLTPLIDAAIYGTVFGMLQGAKRPEHFVQFIIAGIFLFRFFSNCLSSGAKAITKNQALVQSLSFPRMVLPLATVLEQLINFLPILVVLLLLTLFLNPGASWNWLGLAPTIILLTLFNAGMVMIVARVAVHFRYIGQIIPFVNRFMRYFSGVFYSPAKFVGHLPIVMALFTYNPVYDYMEMARAALIPGYVISMTIIWSGIGWAIGGFVLGCLFFWSAEERYGRTD